MPMRPRLLQDIQASLGPSITPSLTVADAAGDIYEAYLFALIVQAAEAEGGQIAYSDFYGVAPAVFQFRTSPGEIYNTNYCHAVIDLPPVPALEAHLGIYVSGKSGVRHESDVAVLFQQEAQTCRLNHVTPRCSQVILSVECKFYAPGGLGLQLGRSFMGLCQDYSTRDCHFVANTSSGSVSKLLAHHNKNWAEGVVPNVAGEVTVLRSRFQSSFKNLKARYA